MGGTVAVTLREKNGEEHRMLRWTNTLPTFIEHIDFVQKKQTHVENYMEQWNLMKKDWEDNNQKNSFVYTMTKVYAPYPYGLFPGGYGLVVIDMVNDVILSMQGYKELGHLNVAKIYIESGSANKCGKNNHDADSAYCQAKCFMDAKKGMPIYMKIIKDGPRTQYIEIEEPQKTFEQFIDDIKKDMGGKASASMRIRPWELRIDLSPFKILSFDESDPIKEWVRFKKEIEKLDFVLNEKEEGQWEKHIKKVEEDLDV
jgi:hypothetical protein